MADATVSAAGMRVIRLLVGNPPQTVSDLIRITGVTRTAVTEQLNELVAGGFAERSVERLPGRGRPRHLYSATSAALLLLFASNQSLVVPAIWRAVEAVGGRKMLGEIHARVSAEMAEHYSQQITAKSPDDRLRQLADILRREGDLVEIEAVNGDLVMRRRSCGFFSMFEEKRSVCAVDSMMLSKVIGRPVRQISCRHDGAPCCSFEIARAD